MVGLLVKAQGPDIGYYYNLRTDIPWAKCSITYKSGSKQKIPFLPVINNFAPTGTAHYTKDVNIQCAVVFVGNGIENNDLSCYEGLDVSNKAVMFFYDFPDSVHKQTEKANSLKTRLEKAIDKNVLAIILCSYENETPFLAFQYDFLEKTEIPIITINKSEIKNIFSASGLNFEETSKSWIKGNLPKSKELISNITLHIKGQFDETESKYGTLFYNSQSISKKEMKILASKHDNAVKFLLNLFNLLNPVWKKTNMCYFADYDSKVFYTHHWGYAASHITGNYYVYKNSYGSISENAYGLIVHENTHTLFFKNWMDECKGANSFFFEGTAMYAQAMATDPNENNRKTYQYIKNGQLFPLTEMLEFNIGLTGIKTDVGYPASGSLVQHLIETYSLENFMIYWRTGSWEEAFHKTVDEIENEWRSWLKTNSNKF